MVGGHQIWNLSTSDKAQPKSLCLESFGDSSTNKSTPKVKAEEALTTLNLGHKSPQSHQ